MLTRLFSTVLVSVLLQAVTASPVSTERRSAADITVTAPSATSPWTQDENGPIIIWLWVPNIPDQFSILLSDISDLSATIATNVQTTDGNYTVPQVVWPAGDGYQLSFVDTTDSTNVYTQSDLFTILPPDSLV